jgi:putative ABC transport system ATP-binding protein
MAVESLYAEPEQPAEQLDWPPLEFHDVFKIYRSESTETVALRGLDLRIERGEFVAVLGPSGCGKSTMLTLACGLDQPSAGEVRSFGRSLSRLSEPQLAAYRGGEVAIVFQSDNLWPALSARENVVLALRLAGGDNAGAKADEALQAFGLGRRLHNRPSELSGGEQQRVAIAAAAVRGASLTLADEPTGELDRENEVLVLEALMRLRSQFDSSIVVVTHSSAVAEAADRVIQLRDGMVSR